MEKEVICWLYTFSVKLQDGVHDFYFEYKSDAEIARFSVYKAFDKQRLSIENFNVPVTKPRRVKVEERYLDRYKVLSSYHDFEKSWFNLTEQMIERESKLSL